MVFGGLGRCPNTVPSSENGSFIGRWDFSVIEFVFLDEQHICLRVTKPINGVPGSVHIGRDNLDLTFAKFAGSEKGGSWDFRPLYGLIRHEKSVLDFPVP